MIKAISIALTHFEAYEWNVEKIQHLRILSNSVRKYFFPHYCCDIKMCQNYLFLTALNQYSAWDRIVEYIQRELGVLGLSREIVPSGVRKKSLFWEGDQRRIIQETLHQWDKIIEYLPLSEPGSLHLMRNCHSCRHYWFLSLPKANNAVSYSIKIRLVKLINE